MKTKYLFAAIAIAIFISNSDEKAYSQTRVETITVTAPYAKNRTGQWWCDHHFANNLGGVWACVGNNCSQGIQYNETVICQSYADVQTVKAYSPANGRTGQWWCDHHFGDNVGGTWVCIDW